MVRYLISGITPTNIHDVFSFQNVHVKSLAFPINGFVLPYAFQFFLLTKDVYLQAIFIILMLFTCLFRYSKHDQKKAQAC